MLSVPTSHLFSKLCSREVDLVSNFIVLFVIQCWDLGSNTSRFLTGSNPDLWFHFPLSTLSWSALFPLPFFRVLLGYSYRKSNSPNVAVESTLRPLVEHWWKISISFIGHVSISLRLCLSSRWHTRRTQTSIESTWNNLPSDLSKRYASNTTI